MDDPSLDAALTAFDRCDANLRRLESIWEQMSALIPQGIAFLGGSPDDARYRELAWGFNEIASALPAVDGYRIAGRPLELNEIAQGRLDAAEIGELGPEVALAEAVDRPGQEMRQYRLRMDRARRGLVRAHVEIASGQVDRLLAGLVTRHARDADLVVDEAWDAVKNAVNQIERLVGAQVPRTTAWADLTRHLRFGQGHDLHDIADTDWPAVSRELQTSLYSELEPLPVQVEDIGVLASSGPAGHVTSHLNWPQLTAEDFERLLFNILLDAPEYENVRWLTHTHAPDRGRDLSADRTRTDSLSGVIHERVIVQAKNWLAASVAADDVAAAVAQMELWQPPPVHVLAIATSGRFTTGAIEWIERRHNNNAQPKVEMWACTDLELILARRPHLAAGFRLR